MIVMTEKKLDNKEILNILEKGKGSFRPGHRTCAGCFIPTIVRTILGNVPKGYEPVVSIATGCLEVTSTLWPNTSWNLPVIHNDFENASVTLAGVERAHLVNVKKGLEKPNKKFIAIGGDGGTVDIGLAAISGTLERGHDILYVLYTNEVYSNTGSQRSGDSPIYANTSTTPIGKDSLGKEENRKDIMQIIAGHNIPYVAQCNPYYLDDFVYKVKKAFSIKGPKFLNVLMPCTFSWKFETNLTAELSKLATETNVWPLYEIENGKYTLNYIPKKPLNVEEYFKHQGRFKHLFNPINKTAVKNIQNNIDNKFQNLKELSNKK